MKMTDKEKGRKGMGDVNIFNFKELIMKGIKLYLGV